MRRSIIVLILISIGFPGVTTYFSKEPVEIHEILCYSLNETFSENWWEDVDIGCIGNITFLNKPEYNNCIEDLCYSGTLDTVEAIVYPEGINKSECEFQYGFITEIHCHPEGVYLATGRVFLNRTLISFFERPKLEIPIYELIVAILLLGIAVLVIKILRKKRSHFL